MNVSLIYLLSKVKTLLRYQNGRLKINCIIMELILVAWFSEHNLVAFNGSFLQVGFPFITWVDFLYTEEITQLTEGASVGFRQCIIAREKATDFLRRVCLRPSSILTSHIQLLYYHRETDFGDRETAKILKLFLTTKLGIKHFAQYYKRKKVWYVFYHRPVVPSHVKTWGDAHEPFIIKQYINTRK